MPIDSIELSSKDFEIDDLSRKLSPLGKMEAHNLIISVKKEYVLTGLYGLRKRFKTIALHVDEPKAFKEKMELALEK
ncbi:hypothetical protein ABIB40_001411 [Pedobacter sp. UYP30]|uniref:hypothetical protein n=1 Tax=Pedobacter sp. UYP30 TaxID=1756400 RepID=UPI00339554D1